MLPLAPVPHFFTFLDFVTGMITQWQWQVKGRDLPKMLFIQHLAAPVPVLAWAQKPNCQTPNYRKKLLYLC